MNALAYIDNYSREREGKGAHILATLHPCGQFHQHVYAKFLHAQIPKAQKRQSSHHCLFALSGSAHIKAALKTFLK